MGEENCIFCKIAGGQIPAATIYEDEDFRAILDLGPAQRGHALVLSKAHFADSREVPEELLGRGFALAARLGGAVEKALSADGFNLLQNNGSAAGQTVFHFHIHVIPRYKEGAALLEWTPGSTEGEDLPALAKAIASAL